MSFHKINFFLSLSNVIINVMDEAYGYYTAELFMISEYSIVFRSPMKKQPVIIIQSNFLLLTLNPSNSWTTMLGTAIFNTFSHAFCLIFLTIFL